MKKIIFSILSIMILVFGGISLAGCNNNPPKASIELINVPEEGINLDVTTDQTSSQFKVKVTGVNNGQIEINNDYQEYVSAKVVSYDSDSQTSTVLVTGIKETESAIELQITTTMGSADPVAVDVYVYSTILGMSQKSDVEGVEKTQYIVKGTDGIELLEDRFLEISSREDGKANKKNIVWSLSEEYSNVSLDGNILKVEEEYEGEYVILKATDEVSQIYTFVELEVVKGIGEITLSKGRTIDVADGLVNEVEPYQLVRNDDGSDKSELYIKLEMDTISGIAYNNGTKDIVDCRVVWEVKELEDYADYLAIDKQIEKIENGKVYWIYKFTAKKNSLNPKTLTIRAKIEYSKYDYGKYIEINSVNDLFTVISSDVVDTLNVYHDGVLVSDSKISMFNNYAQGYTSLSVTLGPKTASDDLKKYCVWFNSDPTGIIEFKDQSIKITKIDGIWYLTNEDKNVLYFDNQTEINVKANTTTKSIIINFQAFDSSLIKKFTIQTKKAPFGDFEITTFESEDCTIEGQTAYIPTNEKEEFECSVEFSLGISSDIKLDYETSLPIELTWDETGELKVNVKDSNFTGEVEVGFIHESGYKSSKKIILEFFVALESYSLGIDKTSSATITEIDFDEDDNLDKLTLQAGTSVQLLPQNNSEATLTWSWEPKDPTTETNMSKLFTIEKNLLTVKNLSFTGELTVTFKGLDKDHEEKSVSITIELESYIPVTNLKADTSVEVYAKDSIASEDNYLSEQHVVISLRGADNNPVTYKDADLFSFKTSTGRECEYEDGDWSGELLNSSENFYIANINISGNNLEFDVIANSTGDYNSLLDSIVITYKKFETISISSELLVKVKNAERVQSVSWMNNTDDGIYINSTLSLDVERSFTLLTNVQPTTAYNSALKYIYVPKVGSSNVININEKTGLITAPTMNVGGSGTLYVLPVDSIKKINGEDKFIYWEEKTDGSYEKIVIATSEIATIYDDIIEKGYFKNGADTWVSYSEVIISTKVTVADGQSFETAIRIYDKNGFKAMNLSLKYELMNDITLDDWNHNNSILTGGLKGNKSSVTITLTGTSLYKEISEGVEVKDLTFRGEVSTGFVAEINNGTVSNVSVDVQTGITTIPSKVTGNIAGGIAGENAGNIENVSVLGLTISGTTVGGISGKNSGTITGAYVEFYNFAENINNNKLSGTTVGGLVGESTGGVISASYVYDYTLSKSKNEPQLLGTTVGLFVGFGANTEISNSFAVVGNLDYVGNNSEYEVKDCYKSYYAETEFKSDSTTTTNSENWVDEEDIVSWVNGGNSHLKFYQKKALGLVEEITVKDIAEKAINADKEDKKQAILMLTTVDADLDASQRSTLQKMNTIYYTDLFEGIDDDLIDSLLVESSNAIVQTSSTSLYIRGTGTTILTLRSRQDMSISGEIEIKVVYSISEFKAFYHSNGGELTEVETVAIQEGKSIDVQYRIKEKIYLGSTQYDLIQNVISIEDNSTNDSKVVQIINGMIGSVIAKEASDGESYSIKTQLNISGLDGQYATVIKNKYTKIISVTVFEGSTYIGVSVDELTLYPSMIAKLKVDLVTDSSSDSIKLDLKLGDTTLNKSEEDGNIVFSYGEARINALVKGSVYNETTNTISYEVTLYIVDTYKHKVSEVEAYTLLISSESGTSSNENKEVSLLVQSQKIDFVHMENYKHQNATTTNGTTYFERSDNPVSVMSPGSTSYLEVTIDPAYAYYSYFTLTSEAQNGRNLVITKLKYLKEGNNYVNNQYQIDNGIEVSTISNGVKVDSSYPREDTFAFRIYVPGNVENKTTFPITLTLYDANGKEIKGIDSTYYLYISALKEAGINTADGKNILSKGSSKELEVTVEKDQEVDSVFLRGIFQGVYLTEKSEPIDNGDGTKTYKLTLYSSVTAKTTNTSGLGLFTVVAQVRRVFDGQPEIKQTELQMTLAQFSIKGMTVNDANDDYVEIYVGRRTNIKLGYVFDPETYSYNTSDTSEIGAVEELNEAREDFIGSGSYSSENFAINSGKSLAKRLKINGYSIPEGENTFEEKGEYKVEVNNNELYITGHLTTQLTIEVENIITNGSSSDESNITHRFIVKVSQYTDEKFPQVINSAEAFSAIRKETDRQNFILTSDIYLDNYIPFDTSKIETFDGNGYTIYINSFDAENHSGKELNLALFTNVIESTTLKNIRVNLYGAGQEIVVQTEKYTSSNIAGFAIKNEGIITNCEVVAFEYQYDNVKTTAEKVGLNVKYKNYSTEVYINSTSSDKFNVAGFVITNDGTITNSRVGGTSIVLLDPNGLDVDKGTQSFTRKALGLFTISSSGNIGGFVKENTLNGVIASSYVDNFELINDSESTLLNTAGFVLTNSGRISTSYVQGSVPTAYVLGNTACMSGSSISSKGTIAGFVYKNNKEIDNSYSNILIKGIGENTQSSFGAGFVYINEGKISTCYSGCALERSNLSQSNFSGIDDAGRSLNSGTIELSYYNGKGYLEDPTTMPEMNLDTGASIIKEPGDVEEFYGFTFASSSTSRDGVWYLNEDSDTEISKPITLVSANDISYSFRYEIKNTVTGKQELVYATLVDPNSMSSNINTVYGSSNNPIIIRTSTELQDALGNNGEDVYSFYTSSQVVDFVKKEIKGHYRLVADIDLSELNTERGYASLGSSSMSFSGSFDGNGFEIKNISITTSSSQEYLGLFGKIDGGSVLNLDLGIVSVYATDVVSVGVLTGIANDANIINISATQKLPAEQEQSKKYGVYGQNTTGGLVGSVFGSSKLKGLSIYDAIVQSSYYNKARSSSDGSGAYKYYEGTLDNNNFNSRAVYTAFTNGNLLTSEMGSSSFAGGLVGYIDTNGSGRNGYTHEPAVVANNTRLRANNTINVRAEVAGGLIGYTGYMTGVEDAGLILSEGDVSSTILSYNAFAGGLVGISRGKLEKVFSEHDDDLQDSIENSMKSYYKNTSTTSAERGILDLFESNVISETSSEKYTPKYIGGLVGLLNGGEIEISYSKLNVINKTALYAGGIAGKIYSTIQFSYKTEAEEIGRNTNAVLFEVYASGDVKGQVSGGIIGQIDKDTKVVLSAVNAVNYFSYHEYSEGDLKEDNGELSLSKVNVNAFVGEGGTIKRSTETNGSGTIIPVVPSIASVNGENSSIARGHLKYYGEIYASAFTKSNGTEGVSSTEINPIYIKTGITVIDESKDVSDYSSEEKDSNINSFIKIPSLSNMVSSASGYEITSGAFLLSGYWDNQNWRHNESELYPRINLVARESYIYLDCYNIDQVIGRIKQDPTVEVRVRGLKDTSSSLDNPDSYKNIDFSGKKIDEYSGKMVAWPHKDENNTNEYVYITSAQSIFGSLNGATIEGVKFKFSSESELTVIGGGLVSKNVDKTIFKNVELDFSENTKITLYDSHGYAGLVAPQIVDSNFEEDLKIKLPTPSGNEKETVTIINEGNGSGSALYGGLIAGTMQQTNQYKSMDIEKVTIEVGTEDSTDKNVYLNFNRQEGIDSLYMGLYVGKVCGELYTAPINLSAWTTSGAITLNVPAGLTNVYAGGYYGYVDNTSSLTLNGEDGFDDATIVINNKSTNEVHLGGLVGQISRIDKINLKKNLKFTANANATTTGDLATLVSLYTGAIAGNNSNAVNITRDGEINITTTLKATASVTISELYFGGAIGLSKGEVKASRLNITLNDVVNNLKSKMCPSSTDSISTGTSYIGGVVGKTSGLDIDNVITKGYVSISTTESSAFGGIAGEASSDIEISTSSSEIDYNVVGNSSNSIYLGGLVGNASNDSNAELKISNKTTDISDITSNFFVNAKKVIGGGLVGQIKGYSNPTIGADSYQLRFGGAFKVYGKESNEGNVTFGGIVGVNIGVNNSELTLKKCLSYGDVFVTYDDSSTNVTTDSFTKLTTYNFGGLIGSNNAKVTLTDNSSLMTSYNPRCIDSSTVKALVRNGIGGSSSDESSGNKYCSSVCLAHDEIGDDTVYCSENQEALKGWNPQDSQQARESIAKETAQNGGTKLNPKKVSDGVGSSGYNSNGITYYYIDTETITSSINSTLKNTAIIGNMNEVTYSGSDSFIEKLGEYSFVSGFVLNNDRGDSKNQTTTKTTVGGVVGTQSDGIIYAVGVKGTLSVGSSNSTITLGGIVGAMEKGLIDESYSELELIYRAKSNGTASAIANATSETANAYIINTYSTGAVRSYINANLYAFTKNGKDDNKITVKNSYTISRIDLNDYTTVDDPSGTTGVFGSASLENCWYDSYGCEISEDNVTNSQGKALSFKAESSNKDDNWKQDKNKNYGYQTRLFGYLQQDTGDGSEENPYQIPNATKFAQINDNLSENYKLVEDIDVSKTKQLNIATEFTGTLDGNGHTIDNNTATLFTTLNGGTVKNLRVTNAKSENYALSAVLVTTMNSGTIENVLVSGFANTAGIVAEAEGGKITNCTNYAKVKGSGIVGGIVGKENKATISGCVNYGPIETTGSCAGGIAGKSSASITNCGNTTSVLAGYTTTSDGCYYAGGIVGYTTSTVSGCYNTAMVKAGNKEVSGKDSCVSRAGGIAGYATATVSGCYNSGVVEALGQNVQKKNISVEGLNTKNGFFKVEQEINVYANVIANGSVGTDNENQGMSFENGINGKNRYKKDDKTYTFVGYDNGGKLNFSKDEIDIDNGITVNEITYTVTQVIVSEYDPLGYPSEFFVEENITIKFNWGNNYTSKPFRAYSTERKVTTTNYSASINNTATGTETYNTDNFTSFGAKIDSDKDSTKVDIAGNAGYYIINKAEAIGAVANAKTSEFTIDGQLDITKVEPYSSDTTHVLSYSTKYDETEDKTTVTVFYAGTDTCNSWKYYSLKNNNGTDTWEWSGQNIVLDEDGHIKIKWETNEEYNEGTVTIKERSFNLEKTDGVYYLTSKDTFSSIRDFVETGASLTISGLTRTTTKQIIQATNTISSENQIITIEGITYYYTFDDTNHVLRFYQAYKLEGNPTSINDKQYYYDAETVYTQTENQGTITIDGIDYSVNIADNTLTLTKTYNIEDNKVTIKGTEYTVGTEKYVTIGETEYLLDENDKIAIEVTIDENQVEINSQSYDVSEDDDGKYINIGDEKCYITDNKVTVPASLIGDAITKNKLGTYYIEDNKVTIDSVEYTVDLDGNKINHIIKQSESGQIGTTDQYFYANYLMESAEDYSYCEGYIYGNATSTNTIAYPKYISYNNEYYLIEDNKVTIGEEEYTVENDKVTIGEEEYNVCYPGGYIEGIPVKIEGNKVSINGNNYTVEENNQVIVEITSTDDEGNEQTTSQTYDVYKAYWSVSAFDYSDVNIQRKSGKDLTMVLYKTSDTGSIEINGTTYEYEGLMSEDSDKDGKVTKDNIDFDLRENNTQSFADDRSITVKYNSQEIENGYLYTVNKIIIDGTEADINKYIKIDEEYITSNSFKDIKVDYDYDYINEQGSEKITGKALSDASSYNKFILNADGYIKYKEIKFTGMIFGNGHFINYYDTESLFTSISSGGVIKDLNVGGVIETVKTSYFILFPRVTYSENIQGMLVKGNDGTLKNISTYGSITTGNKYYTNLQAGGVACSLGEATGNINSYVNFSSWSYSYSGSAINFYGIAVEGSTSEDPTTNFYGTIVGYSGDTTAQSVYSGVGKNNVSTTDNCKQSGEITDKVNVTLEGMGSISKERAITGTLVKANKVTLQRATSDASSYTSENSITEYKVYNMQDIYDGYSVGLSSTKKIYSESKNPMTINITSPGQSSFKVGFGWWLDLNGPRYFMSNKSDIPCMQLRYIKNSDNIGSLQAYKLISKYLNFDANNITSTCTFELGKCWFTKIYFPFHWKYTDNDVEALSAPSLDNLDGITKVNNLILL